MRHLLFFLSFLFYAATSGAQYTVRIQVDSLPVQPQSTDLYIAGSFNNWNPGDEKYMFQRKGNGQFYIDLNLAAGQYEYKITRGSWKEAECSSNGADRSNRELKVNGNETITISISGWKDNFAEKGPVHTASKNVQVIDTAFYMPQLKRKRRIQIYLPDDYHRSKKRYPVMYVHDGQNVFDAATSYAGEWGIDEYMDTTRVPKCIIVSVDNGGLKRMNEYCPFDFSPDPRNKGIEASKGEGKEYVDFLAKTLKPFIDKRFRTRKESRYTNINGASMGGLISLYAILKYPGVFGSAGVFSPSVWICRSELVQLIQSSGKNVKGRIYFYCGKQESDEMVSDMLLAFQKMASVSKARMTTVIRDDGRHNEKTWQKEFPLFYEWLMQ